MQPYRAEQTESRLDIMDDQVRFALEKLLNVAYEDSSQGRRMANFILAWWNADVHGGFDLTDLADLDPHVCNDMVTIFTWLAKQPTLIYPDDYKPEILQTIALWRPHLNVK